MTFWDGTRWQENNSRAVELAQEKATSLLSSRTFHVTAATRMVCINDSVTQSNWSSSRS
jgi:hypothetical protein